MSVNDSLFPLGWNETLAASCQLNQTGNGSWNTTAAMTPKKDVLFTVYRVLLTSLLVLIMLAMGCEINLRQMARHLRRPWLVLVGVGCQFGALPLLAFAIAHAVSLRPEHAIGMLFAASCPGGAVSNLFSYWVDGDVSLSVTMTTLSTILAFGMLPLNIWIYSRAWSSYSVQIPYTNIVITLVSILVPVAAGFLINWKFPKAGRIITKIGSIAGCLCIGIVFAMQWIMYPALLNGNNWRIWIAALLVPAVGFSCGYGCTAALRYTAAQCRTVALETGSQNVALALSAIAISYDKDLVGQYSIPAIFYGMTMSIESVLTAGIYRLVLCIRQQKKSSKSQEEDVNNAKCLDGLLVLREDPELAACAAVSGGNRADVE